VTRGIKRDGAIDRLCVPVGDWPTLDRNLWQCSLVRPTGLFGESGTRAHLRPATNRAVAKGYGRWLQALSSWGELDAVEPPGQRITLPRVRRYVEDLKAAGNHASTIAVRLEELRAAAKVMDPDADWDWLKPPAARLRAASTPLHDKRERLVAAGDLHGLGLTLGETAAARRKPGHRLVNYRDGLMIAFLALQPLRLKNLAGLVIGQTLVKAGGRWMVVLPGDQTKTHAPIEVTWPESLVPALEHYLTTIRPSLAARRRTSPIEAGDYLWISAEGRPLSEKRIHHAIKLRTGQGLGKSVNPHLARDIAATTLAIEDPLHVRAAAPLLGHASLGTTERHYQQATALQAQRALSVVVARSRKTPKSRDD
jgi:site-specific recombinase XerD